MKGCWMKISVEKDTVLVRFKDYGFFVPKTGIEGKRTIINGNISIDTLSVSQLQHYAEDAGKSKEEIALITKPEITIFELYSSPFSNATPTALPFLTITLSTAASVSILAPNYSRFGPLMGQVGMAVRPILETIAPNAIKPSINDLLSLKGFSQVLLFQD